MLYVKFWKLIRESVMRILDKDKVNRLHWRGKNSDSRWIQSDSHNVTGNTWRTFVFPAPTVWPLWKL